MDLVFDAAALIYLVEGLGCAEVLTELNARNGAVVIPRAILAEFARKPKDATMPGQLANFVCEDPPLDNEIDPGTPGPLSKQDRIALQTARIRGALLATDDVALTKESARHGVTVLGIEALLDHALANNCLERNQHPRLKKEAAALLSRD